MANFKRKVDDEQIVSLNSVGISLSGIARRLGVHHTTVTIRLKELGIKPADTRRSFMEEVYDGLTDHQRDWLVEQLRGGRPVKDLVKSLLLKEYILRNQI